MNRFLAFIILAIAAVAPVNAQFVTLTVNAASGTVRTGMDCPSPANRAAYAAVQAALDCAPDGSVILVSGGTYSETLTVSRSVTLQGESGQTIELAGDGGRPVISAAEGVTLILENLTLTNGAGDRGGGLFMPSGRLRLQNVTVRGNLATVSGGGLFLGSGSAEISGSLFARNSVTAFGGDGVSAEAYGGAIYVGEGSLLVVNSRLSDNTVAASSCEGAPPQARGSAIFSRAAQVVLAGVEHSGRALTSTCGGAAQVVTAGDAVLAVAADLLAEADPAAVELTISMSTSEPVLRPDAAPAATNSDPALAVAWMGAVMEAVRAERLSPPVASRVYAYSALTLYESLRPGRQGRSSFAGILNGRLELPAAEANLRYDWPTVANAALHRVTTALFTSGNPEVRRSLDATRDRINLALGDYVPVNVFNRSVLYGDAVAAAVLAWAAADNYDASRDLTYTLPDGDPGYWRPLEGQRALEPFWGVLRPFALRMPNDCEIEPPFEASTSPDSLFYAEALEVAQTVQSLTPEQREIALFWADNPGDTATPPGHWISIIGIIVRQRQLSLEDAADLYAITGIALADAFIAAWHTKYQENRVRPVTFIRDHIDPDFQTVVATPPFPEYPSGHSVASGAASVILTQLVGDRPFDDVTHLSRGLAPRRFDSFEQVAIEAATSRLYGGIHYASSNSIGLEMGRCVGRIVLERAGR